MIPPIPQGFLVGVIGTVVAVALTGAALSSDPLGSADSPVGSASFQSTGKRGRPVQEPKSVSVDGLKQVMDQRSLYGALGSLQQVEDPAIILHFGKGSGADDPAVLSGSAAGECNGWRATVTGISEDGVVSYDEPVGRNYRKPVGHQDCSLSSDGLYGELFLEKPHALVVYAGPSKDEYVIAHPGATHGLAFRLLLPAEK